MSKPLSELAASPVKAILVGLALDIAGSLLLSVLMMVAYALSLQRRGLSSEEIAAAMSHMSSNAWVVITGIVLGAILDVLSGFVCARMAKRREYECGVVLALISASLTAGSSTDATDEVSVLLTLCTVACTLLGARYGRAQNRR